MADARATDPASRDPADTARLHTILRFAAGTAIAFVICEAMGWYPSFLAPLFAAALIGNLPMGLPAKAGVGLVIVVGGSAYAAALLGSMLHDAPFVQFGLDALIFFVCLANLAQGKGFLPLLLIMVSFAAIPVVTMVLPQQAGAMPLAFLRAIILAVIMVWVTHALWPESAKPAAPAPSVSLSSPIAVAVAGTAILAPMVLVYMMFGITDALPVLITTVILVTTFDARSGVTQGIAMVIANLMGGVGAVISFMLLQVAPSLVTLGLIVFLVGIIYGARIERGGPGGSVALITFNQTAVMLSLALLPGGAAPGLWMTRVFQFGLATVFATGMMTLVLHRRAKPLAAAAGN